MLKVVVIGLGLLMIAGMWYDTEHIYPKHYNDSCYAEWRPNHYYRHEVHYNMTDCPDVVTPNKPWTAPLLYEEMCLDPTGAWRGIVDERGIPAYENKNSGEIEYSAGKHRQRI